MAANESIPTILVVEPDEILGPVLVRLLSRENRAVIRAMNAAQALELADAQRPQVALVDLSLRDLDAVELAKTLRARHTDLDLIVMTTMPLQLRRHTETAGPFTCILIKPLDMQRLCKAVDAGLDRYGSKAMEVKSARKTALIPGFSRALALIAASFGRISRFGRWLKLTREPEPPEWSVAQLSQELGIPSSTIRDWIHSGLLEACKEPGILGRWICWADAEELDRLRRFCKVVEFFE